MLGHITVQDAAVRVCVNTIYIFIYVYIKCLRVCVSGSLVPVCACVSLVNVGRHDTLDADWLWRCSVSELRESDWEQMIFIGLKRWAQAASRVATTGVMLHYDLSMTADHTVPPPGLTKTEEREEAKA